MKVAVFSAKPYDKEFLEAANRANLITFEYFEVRLSEKSYKLAQGFNAVCCFVNDELTAATIQRLKDININLIAMRCAGYNNVDLDKTKELGITVVRVPEYSPYAVAEHTVGLILDLNRNISRAHNRVREGDFSLNGLMGFDLHGKVFGLIGAGKIAAKVARIMNGFGCEVLVNSPELHPEFQEIPHKKVELDLLLAQSDIISLHCPLLPSTTHIINTENIAKMKDKVMIINTSRGALLDTRATIAALKTGKIGWMGLDVYEEEDELFFEDKKDSIIQDDVFARLLTFPNVTVTGHQAFFTKEALINIATTTVNNILSFTNRGNIIQ